MNAQNVIIPDTIKLPYRLEPFGQIGWSVVETTREAAAQFFLTYQSARMPCWSRFEVIGGKLYIVR